MLACLGGIFKERTRLPRQTLEDKTNKKALGIRECEEFGMTLQHKSKLKVNRELGVHVKRGWGVS